MSKVSEFVLIYLIDAFMLPVLLSGKCDSHI